MYFSLLIKTTNQPFSTGATPLHWAAEVGHKEICRLLISYGSPIDARCRSFGHTPLMDAVVWNHADAVTTLLQHGADKTLRNNSGMSPMESYTSDAVRDCLNGSS